MYKVEFTKKAAKDLAKLPKAKQILIVGKLEYFLSTKEPLVFAKRLTNHSLGQYRFRIGEYRVIFDLEIDGTMCVLAVGHRREIYK